MGADGKMASFKLELIPDCEEPWVCYAMAGDAHATIMDAKTMKPFAIHGHGATPEKALAECVKFAEFAGMVVLRGPAQGDVELAALSLFIGRAIYYAGLVPPLNPPCPFCGCKKAWACDERGWYSCVECNEHMWID